MHVDDRFICVYYDGQHGSGPSKVIIEPFGHPIYPSRHTALKTSIRRRIDADMTLFRRHIPTD